MMSANALNDKSHGLKEKTGTPLLLKINSH